MPTHTTDPSITPPTLTVLLQGLVVVNRTEDGFWEAAMLQGIDDHPVKLSVEIVDANDVIKTSDLPIERNARKIEILTSDDDRITETEICEPKKGDSDEQEDRYIKHMGDFASSELHGKRVQLRVPEDPLSLLKFRVKGGKGFSGKFSGDPDPSLYCFGKEGNFVRRIPYQLEIERNLESSSSLTIEIDGVPHSSTPDFSSAKKITITLDNMCMTGCDGPEPPNTDFCYYYSVPVAQSETKRTLSVIAETPPIGLFIVKESEAHGTGKIACNAMLLSKEPYNAGLWDL